MGFIFQRRINLGGGIGFNLSKSGISTSVKSKYRTIRSKGFTIKSGIPGFYYRKRYGKKGPGVEPLMVILIWFLFDLFSFFVQIIILLIPIVVVVLGWVILTIYDFIIYLLINLIESRKEKILSNNTQNNIITKPIVDSDLLSKEDSVNSDFFHSDLPDRNKVDRDYYVYSNPQIFTKEIEPQRLFVVDFGFILTITSIPQDNPKKCYTD